MIIANPIYDTVFKRLMENRRIAQFFVQTLIGEQVDEIAVVPQEYTYKKIRTKRKKIEGRDEEIKEEIFSIIRFDFVATIRTEQGEHKKVLIEIQKSRKPTDLIRFRTYLGEQYQRVDVVNVKNKTVEKALPIVCIYLLGFTIPKYNTPSVRVNRKCWDMITQKEIKHKSDLIEALTHDGYFVQIPRIQGKPHTLLEKMLSVFEQEYFIDEKNIVKIYDHSVDNDIIREMIEILRHTAADPKERRSLEAEWLALKDEEEFEKMREAISSLQQENADKDITIADKEIAIADKNKTIADKDKTIADKDKIIADLQRKLQKTNKTQ